MILIIPRKQSLMHFNFFFNNSYSDQTNFSSQNVYFCCDTQYINAKVMLKILINRTPNLFFFFFYVNYEPHYQHGLIFRHIFKLLIYFTKPFEQQLIKKEEENMTSN